MRLASASSAAQRSITFWRRQIPLEGQYVLASSPDIVNYRHSMDSVPPVSERTGTREPCGLQFLV